MLNAISTFSLIGFSLALLVIAVHLLSIAYRTRKAPELLLGLAFLFMLFGNFVIVWCIEAEVMPEPLRARWIQFGEVGLDIGFIFAAAFNYRVFRRGAGWAKSLAWILCVTLVGAQIASWLMLDHWGRFTAFYWVKFGIRACIYLWTAIEGFSYYRLMSRRVRHGLAEPVVANRFLIWGIAACLALIMLFGFEVGDVLDFRSEAGASLSLLGSLSGAPAGVLFWLTFLAPEGYRKFVQRRSSVGRVDSG